MVLIIFSDLHSNMEALDSFQREIKDIPHDHLICLGDTVGYGADPNVCVGWVRKNAEVVLAGNHDYAVVEKTNTDYFNPYALEACMWTRKNLSSENREYLSSLYPEKEQYGVYWVHSSPFEPVEWHYVTSVNEGFHFDYFNAAICFLGHSHVPLVLEQTQEERVNQYSPSNSPSKFKLNSGRRYIVNVGSLGQPRDGNPDPCFVVYNLTTGTIEFRRFSYDIAAAQEKILNQGLPPFLAQRLSLGN